MVRRKSFELTLPFCAFVCQLCIANAPVAAQTETWYLDPPHSAAQFSVRHMGISTVRGTFTKVSGDVKYSPSDPSKSSVEVTIDANSVDTRVERRDNDLRSPHFLDVAKYPTITFKSKRVEAAGAGKLKVTGDLTIHGVAKEVMLDVDGPTPPIKDPRGNLHMGASATAKINRQDFGMTGMSGMVGDEVAIVIDVELVQYLVGPPPGASASCRASATFFAGTVGRPLFDRSKKGPVGPWPTATFSGRMESMKIEYTVHIWKERGQFVAHAMPLDVVSSGRTTDEARAALDEAVHLFLATAAAEGSLEEILHEAGYELRDGEWISPSWVAIEKHSTAVPA